MIILSLPQVAQFIVILINPVIQFLWTSSLSCRILCWENFPEEKAEGSSCRVPKPVESVASELVPQRQEWMIHVICKGKWSQRAWNQHVHGQEGSEEMSEHPPLVETETRDMQRLTLGYVSVARPHSRTWICRPDSMPSIHPSSTPAHSTPSALFPWAPGWWSRAS